MVLGSENGGTSIILALVMTLVLHWASSLVAVGKLWIGVDRVEVFICVYV